jgi:Tol biopolymer transport system component
LPGTVSASGRLDLALFDRKGQVESLKLPPGTYETPRFSPDGTRIAFANEDTTGSNVWILQVGSATPPQRLTFGGRDRFPLWSPDGSRVAFQSDREGDAAIFVQPSDGTGAAERLTKPEPATVHVPEAWSPDGKQLLVAVRKDAVITLWTLQLNDRMLARAGNIESIVLTGAVFSPDGRHIAYTALPRGERQATVFVEPFPTTGAVHQISQNSDAHHVVWSHDGSELLYVPAPGRLFAVKVQTSPRFAVLSASGVFPYSGLLGPPTVARNYDITPDGGRVVGRIVSVDNGIATAAIGIHVVHNLLDELQRPSNRD